MKMTLATKRAAWGILRLFTAISMALSWVATIPATPAAALSGITITAITPYATLDSNGSCVDGPQAMYIQVDVHNSGATVNNVVATLTFPTTPGGTGFTGDWRLDSTESPTRLIGTLTSGATAHLFWFINYPCESGGGHPTPIPMNYSVKVDNGDLSPVTTGLAITERYEISAQAGGDVSSFTIGTGTYLGQIIKMTTLYDFGNISSSTNDLGIQPAGNVSYDSGCYRLIGSDITSVVGITGITTSDDNLLYKTAVNSGGGTNTLTVDYYFAVVCANGLTTTLVPWADMVSGTQQKYTGNFGLCGSKKTDVCDTPNPPSNPLSISKQVSVSVLPTGSPPDVTYKVVIHNSGTVDTYVNSITDVLPAAPAAVSFQGLVTGPSCSSAPDTQVTASTTMATVPANLLSVLGATGTITFNAFPLGYAPPPPAGGTITGGYRVPAGEDLYLCFLARVPSNAGTYTNSATATSGSVTFGPATVDVFVGAANIGHLKTVSSGPTATVNPNEYTITYQIVVANSGTLAGIYNLTDTPMFGAGVTMVSASFTKNGGAPTPIALTPLPWTLATGASLAASPSPNTDTYLVAVIVTVNPLMAIGTSKDCTLGTEPGTGLYNRSSLTFNASTTNSDDCRPTPDIPLLGIVKTATPGTYSAVGNLISYSYKVTNTGNVTLAGPVTVTDDKATVTCPAGGLAPGAFMTCTASYTITQTDLDNGSVKNTAQAHANGTDSNQDDETVTAVARPELTLVKTVTPGTYSAVGNLISYSYKVTNSGNVTLAGPVTVTDDKATVTCPAGGLAPGAFMTCTASYTITQTDLDSGSVKNTAQAHANGTDSNQDDETVGKVSITKTIIPPDDQGFTTSPDVAIGEIVRFRVAAQVPAGSFPNASIVDALGPGLAFVSCVGITPSGLSSACSSPTVEAGGLTVTFPLGNLLYAESGTITIDYEAVVLDIVDNKNGVDRFNTVNFVWGVENDRSTIGPAHETVHILEPSLFITKAADTPFVEEGLEFHYTLAVQHTTGTSTTDAYDVEVDDTLPAGLQLASPLDLDCGVSPGKPADACTGVAGGNVIHAEYASLLFGPPAEQAIIRFKVKAVGLPPGEILNSASAEWTSLPLLAGVLRSTYNDSSTERGFAGDPSDPLNPNRYFASSSTPVTPLGGGGGCTGGNCGKPGIGGFLIPVTGFTPGVVTALGPQSAVYDDNMGVTLEIPKMKLKMSIVGVPLVGGTWKVDWLSGVGGWLQGTAFPGLSGNSVITSHVVSHYGTDGPFAHLNTLGVGDKIFITAFNRQYIYEVKSVGNVAPNDISVFKHELKPVLTLITCSKYNAATQTYDARLVVRTALLEVRALK